VETRKRLPPLPAILEIINRRGESDSPYRHKGGIHFGTAVGQQALWAAVSVVNSHRSDDSGSKVGRWPTSGGVTVPKWIPLSAHMRARADWVRHSIRRLSAGVGRRMLRRFPVPLAG
jgi:hypothetical protein